MQRFSDKFAAQMAMVEHSQFTDVGRVLAGLGQDFVEAIASGGDMPPQLIEAVLEGGQRVILAALLRNTAVTAKADTAQRLLDRAFTDLDDTLVDAVMGNSDLNERPDLQERLALTGHPRVLERSCLRFTRSHGWGLRLRRTVMAASTKDYSADLEQSNQDLVTLRAAVVSPVPNMVRQAILKLGPQLTVGEQLLAARSIVAHGGGVTALPTLEVTRLRPAVADLLVTIAADGELGRLDDAIAHAESDEGFLAELYDSKLTEYAELLELREPPTWELLIEAARRKPFSKAASQELVKRRDCPAALRDLLFARHPAVVVENAVQRDAALLIQPCANRSRAKATRELIADELGAGISATEAMQYGRPAIAVLESVPPRESHGDTRRAAAQEFAAIATELVAQRLGTELRPWRVMRELLPDFDGTVPELLEAAAAATQTPSGEFPGRSRDGVDNFYPTGADKAFVTLLDVADSAAHRVMFPHMSYMTRQDLLSHCRWRAEWIEMVLESKDPDAQRAFVEHGALEADAIDRFTELTPGIMRGLLAQAASTQTQRESWLRDHAQTVLYAAKYSGPQHWRITDLKYCDSQLADSHIGRRLRYLFRTVQGRIPQLRLFLDTWEAHGADLTFTLLPYEPLTFESYQEARATLEELLLRPDLDAALQELRDIVHHGETAEFQIQSWRTRNDRAGLAGEDHAWHWDALSAAHRREPFHYDAVWRMAQLPGCPQEIKAEAAGILPSRIYPAYTQLMAGTEASTVLKKYAADDRDRNLDQWIPVAIDAGKTDWEQAFQYGQPAQPVLSQLKQKDAELGRVALAALMSRTIGDNPDAWILAVRMLPDFAGTVTELLTTAAAAAG